MSKQPFRNYKKISIYLGYGEAGTELYNRVRDAIKSSGMSARDVLLHALNIQISDDKK